MMAWLADTASVTVGSLVALWIFSLFFDYDDGRW